MMAFKRAYLEKLLAQDFGCTWETARIAVTRYFVEVDQGVPPWWQTLYGNPYAITEWIWGSKHYWRYTEKRVGI